MAGIDPIAFATNIINTCNGIDEVESYDTQIIDNVVVKIRIYLITKEFVDVFYNSDTERIAYALIDSNKRVFGVDNTGGWHIHPLEDPVNHISCHTVSFSDFMKTVQQRIRGGK
jgi:hypothetical protein